MKDGERCKQVTNQRTRIIDSAHLLDIQTLKKKNNQLANETHRKRKYARAASSSRANGMPMASPRIRGKSLLDELSSMPPAGSAISGSVCASGTDITDSDSIRLK
jgi:hypothetical protein